MQPRTWRNPAWMNNFMHVRQWGIITCQFQFSISPIWDNHLFLLPYLCPFVPPFTQQHLTHIPNPLNDTLKWNCRWLRLKLTKTRSFGAVCDEKYNNISVPYTPTPQPFFVWVVRSRLLTLSYVWLYHSRLSKAMVWLYLKCCLSIGKIYSFVNCICFHSFVSVSYSYMYTDTCTQKLK